MSKKIFQIAIAATIALASSEAWACRILNTPEVRNQRTYSQPTDDSTWGDAGYLRNLLDTHGNYYQCAEVTPNGYVKVEHGMGGIFTSYVPIDSFAGPTVNLTNGTRVSIADFDNPTALPDPDDQTGGQQLPPPINAGEDFLDFFSEVARNTSGDRHEFPMSGDGTEGPCGGKHIRSHRTAPHMQPIPACMFARVSQEWRSRFCPDNAPHCRIMYGDAGYGHRRPGEWPHASHTQGQCIDIWPMRNPGAGLVETNVNSSNYNSALTVQFAQLLIEEGGIETANNRPHRPQAFFNDPAFRRLGFRHLVHHDDHLHVCFRNNAENRRRCDEFQRNPNICHFGQPVPESDEDTERATPGPRGPQERPALPFFDRIEL